MLASGLWHGAGWTFAVWGLYYGILIAAYQLAGLRGDWRPAGRLRQTLAWSAMFALIVLGWLIFRSPSLGWLVNVILHAPWFQGTADLAVILITLSMTLFYSLPLFLKMLLDRSPASHPVHAAYYALLTLGIFIYLSSGSPDFIYFQF